jgi:hypothetical protein
MQPRNMLPHVGKAIYSSVKQLIHTYITPLPGNPFLQLIRYGMSDQRGTWDVLSSFAQPAVKIDREETAPGYDSLFIQLDILHTIIIQPSAA